MDQPSSVEVRFDTPASAKHNPNDNPIDNPIDEEQKYRASAYALIAALLRSAPDQEMLDRLDGLSQETTADGDDLLLAMSTLALSAKIHTPMAIDDEFHNLFIGLGKGEVVPYGSWYLTGFLMEKPLSDLRDDLARLGYERNTSVAEPEDHIAALCEVVSLMIAEGADLSVQNSFFQSHMVNWVDQFFGDLSKAKSAVFYKAVARFGAAFIALENEYFSMQT
ncbi:MAG: molecular chaperone TorD family protein [Proteobacteria bacterium]|nr:molecular chaperone TorD family protein [Pseudomonadota bacterium]